MQASRTLGLVVVAALVATAATVTGPDPSDRSVRSVGAAPARAQLGDGTGRTGEYVVAFDDAELVAPAVAASGGRMVRRNDAVGVALVTAPGEAFLAEVRTQLGVTGAARNHAVGTTAPVLAHRYAEKRLTVADPAGIDLEAPGPSGAARGAAGLMAVGDAVTQAEPLTSRQWDMAMIGATPDAAHRHATGDGVRVGIIDTGIDADHPDLAHSLDRAASRNFTTDIPTIDGACDAPDCVDPVGADDNGHGTHVAGTVAAAANGLGLAGVAPGATLVDLRAGQDSGYFFLYETVAALTHAVRADVDVVNMSFYVDPWLYNCPATTDYVDGAVDEEQITQQAVTRRVVEDALAFARAHGVTLVGAAGNGHTDLDAPRREDDTSPNYPEGDAAARTVTDDCALLPAEGTGVLAVSAVGPTGTKADYANYGTSAVDLAAPGGWLRDRHGTPGFGSPANAVLSSYPLDVAVAEGLADEDGRPVDERSVRACDDQGRCGFYTYLQGTSMAAPHVAGVAALVIEAHGRITLAGGHDLPPDRVAAVLTGTARDTPCPPGGVADYDAVGRSPAWRAACAGTAADNSHYGAGIVDAAAAVR